MGLVAIHFIALFVTLLVTVAVAMRRGGPFERWAAYTVLIAALLTGVAVPSASWTGMEVRLFVIDGLVLVSFWLIALKSRRFWPYWVTGWQLIAILVHIQKLMFVEISPRAYSLLSMGISYPILLMILYAAGSSGRTRDITL